MTTYAWSGKPLDEQAKKAMFQVFKPQIVKFAQECGISRREALEALIDLTAQGLLSPQILADSNGLLETTIMVNFPDDIGGPAPALTLQWADVP